MSLARRGSAVTITMFTTAILASACAGGGHKEGGRASAKPAAHKVFTLITLADFDALNALKWASNGGTITKASQAMVGRNLTINGVTDLDGQKDGEIVSPAGDEDDTAFFSHAAGDDVELGEGGPFQADVTVTGWSQPTQFDAMSYPVLDFNKIKYDFSKAPKDVRAFFETVTNPAAHKGETMKIEARNPSLTTSADGKQRGLYTPAGIKSKGRDLPDWADESRDIFITGKGIEAYKNREFEAELTATGETVEPKADEADGPVPVFTLGKARKKETGMILEVRGRGYADITYGSAAGGQQQANGVALPWKKNLGESPGDYVIVAQKKSGDRSAITCVIRDGEDFEQDRKTSTGPYAVVNCS